MTGPRPQFDREAALKAGYSPAEIDAYLGQQQSSSPPAGGTFDRAAAKAAGYSDQEIEEYLKANGPKPTLKQQIHGGAAEFLQGATLGAGGLVDPSMKQAAAEFGQQHKILGPVANAAGSLTGAMALPASWGAKALGRALIGGGSAAVAAGSEGDGTTTDRLLRAGKAVIPGAVLGAAAPVVLGGISKTAAKFALPYVNKARTVANAVGPLLPENAEAQMARLERLAPGTAVPASLSPDMPASVRVIGANPHVAMEAQAASAGRLAKLKTAIEGMGPSYEALLTNGGKPRYASVVQGPSIRGVLTKNAISTGPNDVTDLTTVQRLRDAIRAKRNSFYATAEKGKGGGPKVHELNEDYKQLTAWLEYHAPGISKLDEDYRVLNDAKRAEKGIMGNIRQTRKSYASSRAAGIEPGSPGASLPSKGSILHTLLSPDRKKLAVAANDLLLQPGQIPQSLLDARRRAARVPSGMSGLLGSFGFGSNYSRLRGLLSPDDEN